jgi:hypothetical protein
VVEVVDLIEVVDGAVVRISTYLCPDGSQFLVSLRLSKRTLFSVGLKLLFVSEKCVKDGTVKAILYHPVILKNV